jgi:hypothetical protein
MLNTTIICLYHLGAPWNSHVTGQLSALAVGDGGSGRPVVARPSNGQCALIGTAPFEINRQAVGCGGCITGVEKVVGKGLCCSASGIKAESRGCLNVVGMDLRGWPVVYRVIVPVRCWGREKAYMWPPGTTCSSPCSRPTIEMLL